MDCTTCCSSAAVSTSSSASSSSSSQASRVYSVRAHSSSVICSVDSLRPRGWTIRGRSFNLRTAPAFRVWGSSLRMSPSLRVWGSSVRISTPLFSSAAPVVVSGNAAPLQREDFPPSSSNSIDKASDELNLSAKERRKLRNERREAAIASQEQPWKEKVQDRLLEPKKKIRGWQEDADINRCLAKGVQWWMLQTAKKFEADVAEEISAIFAESFPDREIEVLVPTVPVKTKLKDGSVSLARKKLYHGIVLLRCLLDRDVYFLVRRIPRAYDFFGNQAGLSLQPILMPAPVTNFNMEVMFQKMRKAEEEHRQFKEQCRVELEEEKREKLRKDRERKQRELEEGISQKQRKMEQKLLQSRRPVLALGTSVRVLTGPFLDFTGLVIDLLPNNKVKVLVTVFGNDTPIVLAVEDVVVEAPASDRNSRLMY